MSASQNRVLWGGSITPIARPGKVREVPERVPEGLWRRPDGYGRHLKVFGAILGGVPTDKKAGEGVPLFWALLGDFR